jgi:hypothetical protein
MFARHVFRGLARELRGHGLKVVKVRGWRARGRPGTYAPRAFFEHHTASPRTSGNAPCLRIVTEGRSDVPGPLSQFLIGRDATIYIVASGRCNHAGLGGPHKGIPKDSGNAYAMGVEVENNGVGEPWSPEMRWAMGVLTAVCLKRMRRGARMSIGHKEYAPGRKIDPHGIGMWNFRRRVRRYLERLRAGRKIPAPR